MSSGTAAVIPGLRLGRVGRLFGSRRHLGLRIGVICAGLLVLLAIIGPWLAPHDPYLADPALALKAPSGSHLLGTDDQGRDVLSRLLAGSRTTILSAVGVVAAAAVLGLVLAGIATLWGRWVDEVIMRVCDIVLALPALVLALGIAMVLGPSVRSALIALTVATAPGFARLVRAETRRTMSESYVDAALLMGASKVRIAVRHVLPNSLDTLLTQASFDVGGMVLGLGGLSFVGVGAQPPSAEWGALASDSKGYVVTAWWAALFPGLAITLTVVIFSLLGDAIQAYRDDAVHGG